MAAKWLWPDSVWERHRNYAWAPQFPGKRCDTPAAPKTNWNELSLTNCPLPAARYEVSHAIEAPFRNVLGVHLAVATSKRNRNANNWHGLEVTGPKEETKTIRYQGNRSCNIYIQLVVTVFLGGLWCPTALSPNGRTSFELRAILLRLRHICGAQRKQRERDEKPKANGVPRFVSY